jgi:hypothetical protein
VRCIFVVLLSFVSSFDSAAQSVLRVFPNPVIEYFILNDEAGTVEQIIVFNILGKTLKTFRAADGPRFMVSDLPEGIYLVRFVNANNNIIKTIRISKMRLKA